MKPRRNHLLLLGAISLTLATPSALAATLYWDTDGITSGSGPDTTPDGTWATAGTTWSTSATGALATSALTTTGIDDLFFSAGTDATGTYTVTLGANQTARTLTFQEGAVTVTANTLILTGGGGITVNSGAGNTTISSGLTINGNNTFNVGSGRTLTLSTGTFTRGAGATVNIQGAGTGTSTMTNLSTNVNNIIGPWASVGTGVSTTYAKFSGTSLSGLGYTGGADGSAVATSNLVVTGAGNLNYTLSAVGTLGASASVNTLRYSGAAGTLVANTTFTTKGLMNVSGNQLDFNGTVTAGASGTEMVINAANGDIRLVGTNASLTGTITKTGSGTFTLGSGTGSNFSGIGGITVNEGTFITNAVTANQLVGATINNGGTLQWAGSNKHQDNALFTINAGGILDLNTFSDTIGAIAGAGSITSATAASMTLSGGTQAFSGVIGGAVSLTLNLSPSSSALTLTGTNTFTGTTTITAGSLQLGNGGGAGNLSLITGITNNSNLTINRSNAFDQSLGLAGQAIVGTGSFTQAGAGATTLTANNTFTGATTISAGSLVLGHVTALGGNSPGVNGTSSISMATGTTLRSTVSGVTISAPITTTGSVTIGAPSNNAGQVFSELILNGAIGGAGTTNVDFRSFLNSNTIQTVTLGAASNYSGNTTIGAANAGTDSQVFVKLGIDNALPTTTILSIQGGTGNGSGRGIGLNLFGYNQTLAGLTNTAAASRVQQVVNSDVSAAATLTINGSTDTTYTGFLGFNGANFSVNATAMPGSTNGNNFGLTKDGTGTFTLNPATVQAFTGNTFSGPTKILGGILNLAAANAMSQSPLDTLNSVTGNASRGLRTTVTTLTMGGLTGDKNLVDVFTDATGGPTNTTANGGYDGLTSLTLNPVSGATHSYSGDIGNGNGSMSLTKTGAGTQILSGSNTYTGATDVQGGRLAINGSVTTNITVQTGATLGGNGTITGNVSVLAGGTFAAGNSIDSIAIVGNYGMTNANFGYELDANAALGAEGDLTTVTGNLTLTGTNTLTLTEGGPFGNWTLGSPLGDHLLGGAEKLTLIAYNGTWNGGLFTYLGNLVQDDSAILLNGQQWWFNYNDNDAGINFTPDSAGFASYVTITVPEPRAALLGGLGLLALLRRRRN